MGSSSIGNIDWRGHLSRKEGGGSSCISDNCTFTLCMSSHHAPTRAHFTADQATLCARLLPTGFFCLISFALCVIIIISTLEDQLHPVSSVVQPHNWSPYVFNLILINVNVHMFLSSGDLHSLQLCVLFTKKIKLRRQWKTTPRSPHINKRKGATLVPGTVKLL
jgi:hypothetical protein